MEVDESFFDGGWRWEHGLGLPIALKVSGFCQRCC